MKEMLHILLEEQIPPNYKLQIDTLHPAEEELIVIMRNNNLPIKLWKELLDWQIKLWVFIPSLSDDSCPRDEAALDLYNMSKSLLEDLLDFFSDALGGRAPSSNCSLEGLINVHRHGKGTV
jgi:hypothetical protein